MNMISLTSLKYEIKFNSWIGTVWREHAGLYRTKFLTMGIPRTKTICLLLSQSENKAKDTIAFRFNAECSGLMTKVTWFKFISDWLYHVTETFNWLTLLYIILVQSCIWRIGDQISTVGGRIFYLTRERGGGRDSTPPRAFFCVLFSFLFFCVWKYWKRNCP